MSATPPVTASSPASATGDVARSTLAANVARLWVRVYTARLPDETRDRRRAEIESDLWEHLADAVSHGRRNSSTQLDVLARVLIGTPADVTWHAQTRHHEKDEHLMEHLPQPTERAASPVVATMTILALGLMGLTIFGLATAFSSLVLIPLGVLAFFGTRSVLARRPSDPGVDVVTKASSVDNETPYLQTRRRLRMVLAISGGVFLMVVAIGIVLHSKMTTGDTPLVLVNLAGMVAFFATFGAALLLGANGLGLQQLRIRTARTHGDYRHLRRRAVMTLTGAACTFGLMIAAWMAITATMENFHGGLAILVNVIAMASLLVAGGITWLLAATRPPPLHARPRRHLM